MMQRLLVGFTLTVAVAGSAMAAVALLGQHRMIERLSSQRNGSVPTSDLGQHRMIERLSSVEQTLAAQREVNNAREENRRESDRWFYLLLHAQESPWIGSQDAPVQARLTVESDVVRASEPVRLLAEVRNASKQEQTVSRVVLAPFAFKLMHDGKEVKYSGPQISMPPPPPVVLPPGRIMRQTVLLTPDQFIALKAPGVFSVEWVYASKVYVLGRHPLKVTWVGELPPVKVEWRAQ